ncbi:hypothetical protein IAU60_006617 [Kwoniella sp. DSM 27419]
MLPVDEIVRIAYEEHDHSDAPPADGLATLAACVSGILSGDDPIPPFSASSSGLSVVSFSCLLQDTGFPMEVYLTPVSGQSKADEELDWSKLRERWVGWGVEIPGEQSWVKEERDIIQAIGAVSLNHAQLPEAVHTKFPLPDRAGNYLGALIKVYDDISFKPASTHTFVGLVSSSPFPSNDAETTANVPTIHVLRIDTAQAESNAPSGQDDTVRDDLIDYLSIAFNPPDRLAAEYLLLLLLSSPSSRPLAMPPIGTLSLNFRRVSTAITTALQRIVASVSPNVVSFPLTISLLHNHPFSPCSTDTSSLDAGLLQLSDGTVAIVDEDGMGNGGQLNDKALGNLKSLAHCMTDQKVSYIYPYMEDLKMECAIRFLILSQGKTLLPVDIDIPLGRADPLTSKPPALGAFRSYIQRHASLQHAVKLTIPDETAEMIQEAFVRDRKYNPDSAEQTLKRRMKVARLMALSQSAVVLDGAIWKRTVELDSAVEERRKGSAID